MLYLNSFCSKNVVFIQTVTFLRKKTAGGHTPGLNQRLYLPEMHPEAVCIPRQYASRGSMHPEAVCIPRQYAYIYIYIYIYICIYCLLPIVYCLLPSVSVAILSQGDAPRLLYPTIESIHVRLAPAC
mgnify:CR=1 FL=1